MSDKDETGKSSVQDNEESHTEEAPERSTVDTSADNARYRYTDDALVDEEEEEEEEEMVVLDPDHPLMIRMQEALTKYLSKQLDKLNLELKEKSQELRKLTSDREAIGVNLYGIQQQLAKQQMLLESEHDTHASARQKRIQLEDIAKQIEQLHGATEADLKLHSEKDEKLRADVEALDNTLYYLTQLEKNMHNDINITKRAASKAMEDINKAEYKKYLQDLYVDRTVEQVDKLTQEIAMYDAQGQAQKQETEGMQELLSEASLELEAVLLEKKKLLQQWQTSLIGMQRRDEAKAAMNKAVDLQREKIQSMETELNGYRKSIINEQQRNEQLTMLHNKLLMDMSTVKRHIQTSVQKREQLKTDYSKYAKVLQESEVSLAKTTTERNIKMNQVTNIRTQIEKEAREHQKVHEQIYEYHQKGLTMDKSAQYSEKNAAKTRRQAQELEFEVANVENDISLKLLEISKFTTKIKGLDEDLKNLDQEIRDKNDLISHCESEAVRKNAIIERKQGQIDQFNKKIDQLNSKEGGEEVGPLELQITTLQKQIKDTEVEKEQLEQYWLKKQSHLVQLSSQAQAQWTDVNKMKKQHTILQQKKMRIDSELDTTARETKEQEGCIRTLQNDMTKLNVLINKKTGEKDSKQQDTILMENDFIETLREHEAKSINMQNEVDGLTEEKERLLGSLVDSERQIMLWEKKIQLAKETRSTVDTEYGQGELKAMKCEIHRMQVRYNQLMRQQELLIQEMEKAVGRRETITTRGDALVKQGKKAETKGTLKKKVAELRKKVKSLAQEAANCDSEIHKLQEHQGALAQTLEDKSQNCKELQQNVDSLSAQQEKVMLEKDKVTQDLLSKQKKVKYLDQVKNNKYKMFCKTEEGMEKARAREAERLQSLVNIVDHMNREYPHLKPALHRPTLLLNWRATPEQM
ncbi:coiled-coil domain-containing protein 40-like isoform X3 [Bolinopsis microptera]|uniref:coiled-coil domain-containing protein 40-like isoform X3 n=1 Tax=Bolinopsis microptera TaxID=2820187 RepID=UPI00307AA17F